MTKTPWREVLKALWQMYCCVCRDCFSVTDTPWRVFQARMVLLAMHAAVIVFLAWWAFLGFCVVAAVRMLVA